MVADRHDGVVGADVQTCFLSIGGEPGFRKRRSRSVHPAEAKRRTFVGKLAFPCGRVAIMLIRDIV